MKQNFHLEDSMVMHGISNSDTLEQLIITMHKMHNKISWNEKLFAGKLNFCYHWCLSEDEVDHYAIIFFCFYQQEKNMSKCTRDLSISCECMPNQ